MAAERLYHMWVRRATILPGGRWEERPGYARLTGYPMAHAQCMVMKSKQSRRTQVRTLVFEDGQTPPSSAALET